MNQQNAKSKSFDNKPKLYDPLAFLNKHVGKNVTVYLRKDELSQHIRDIIAGELVVFDLRSGLIVLNTKSNHIVLPNRGIIAYIEIGRGKDG